MTSPISLQDTSDLLGTGFAEMLEEHGPMQDATEVERIVCMAVLPLGGESVAEELTQAVVAVLEELGPPAVPLLAGAEILGAARLRDAAAAALARLRSRGGELHVPAGLGALRLNHAERLRSDSADLYLLRGRVLAPARLARRGRRPAGDRPGAGGGARPGRPLCRSRGPRGVRAALRRDPGRLRGGGRRSVAGRGRPPAERRVRRRLDAELEVELRRRAPGPLDGCGG